MDETTNEAPLSLEQILQNNYIEAREIAATHGARVIEILGRLSEVEMGEDRLVVLATMRQVQIAEKEQRLALKAADVALASLLSLTEAGGEGGLIDVKKPVAPESKQAAPKEPVKLEIVRELPEKQSHKPRSYQPKNPRPKKSISKSEGKKDRKKVGQPPSLEIELVPENHESAQEQSTVPVEKRAYFMVSKYELGRSESHVPPADLVECMLGDLDISQVEIFSMKELKRAYDEAIERPEVKRDGARLNGVTKAFFLLQRAFKILP